MSWCGACIQRDGSAKDNIAVEHSMASHCTHQPSLVSLDLAFGRGHAMHVPQVTCVSGCVCVCQLSSTSWRRQTTLDLVHVCHCTLGPLQGLFVLVHQWCTGSGHVLVEWQCCSAYTHS